MIRLIYLYIFNKATLSFHRFDNILVSKMNQDRVLDSLDAEVMIIYAHDAPSNYILEEALGVQSLWIPSKEGDVISANRSILWLEEPDDFTAIQSFLAYELQALKDSIEAYDKTLRKFTERIKALRSKMELLALDIDLNEKRRLENVPRV